MAMTSTLGEGGPSSSSQREQDKGGILAVDDDDDPIEPAREANSNSAASSTERGGVGRVISPTQEGLGDDFPSYFVCPYTLEPPVNGVTFNATTRSSGVSPQVFEYSRIYRDISMHGREGTFRSFHHPTNGATVRRDNAMSLLRPVSDETQAILTAERVRLGLSETDDLPITLNDTLRYNRTVARVRNP